MNAEHKDQLRSDIIIVGAGPTGLVLANLLGRLGIKTLLVERNETTVKEPRAVSIDDESLRTVQASGLLETVMTEVVPGYGSRYLTPRGQCFLTVRPSGRPYGHPRRNAFRQPVFEQQMRDGLDRFETISTLFGWTLTAFDQDADGVAVEIERGRQKKTLRAQYLVGADGASSFVRGALGIALEGETLPERWLIVDLENSPAERDTMVFCDIARPCIALPGPNRTRRFEYKLFPGEDEAALLQEESIDALLRSRGADPGSRIVRKTIYTFHARLAARWSEGRVFLAGDAAHLTPPFAGQGMNSGIRDAHNLAWKLAAVVRGDLEPAILRSYELERRDHVGSMIELALRMGRIMGPSSRFSGWLTQTAFRVAGVWPALRTYFGEMKYKPKPRFREGLLVPSDHPLVGRLLPQPFVKAGSGADILLDECLPDGFALIGVDLDSETVSRARKLFAWEGIQLKPLAVSTGSRGEADGDALILDDPDRAFADCAGQMLLVRPDRYIMAAFEPRNSAATALRVALLLKGQFQADASPPRATEAPPGFAAARTISATALQLPRSRWSMGQPG